MKVDLRSLEARLTALGFHEPLPKLKQLYASPYDQTHMRFHNYLKNPKTRKFEKVQFQLEFEKKAVNDVILNQYQATLFRKNAEGHEMKCEQFFKVDGEKKPMSKMAAFQLLLGLYFLMHRRVQKGHFNNRPRIFLSKGKGKGLTGP